MRRRISAVALLALVVACGGSASAPAASSTPKGTINAASTNFTENVILGNVYGLALRGAGYTVNFKLNLGSREVIEPALERGEIDTYPEYAATMLEFVNHNAGEATADITPTATKLRSYLEPKGIKALEPSPAVDKSGLVVTKATAQKYNLKTISDLIPIASQLKLGASPQCPTRPYCIMGYKRVYGITFKEVVALDSVGPLTRAALQRGDVDVAQLTTTDGAIQANNWIVLEDDKHLHVADNVIPVIRTAVANPEITATYNKISAALSTTDLQKMNTRVTVDKDDPDQVATDWLKSHRFKT